MKSYAEVEIFQKWELRAWRRATDARPSESNPAAAQYDGLATPSSVRAEYRRRGWKIPRPTHAEGSC